MPLNVGLKTDKTFYQTGQEIVFSETLKNTGDKTLHIYDDTCYRGSDFEFKRVKDGKRWGWTEANGKVAWDGDWTQSSGHTVKPGLRPSNKVLLKPGETLTRTFSALVTRDFRIAFQNHGGSAFTGFSSGKVSEPDLPPKYVGCGWIFNLREPGLYQVCVRYQNDSQWSNGGIGLQPPQSAWIGLARSNPIQIELKQK